MKGINRYDYTKFGQRRTNTKIKRAVCASAFLLLTGADCNSVWTAAYIEATAHRPFGTLDAFKEKCNVSFIAVQNTASAGFSV